MSDTFTDVVRLVRHKLKLVQITMPTLVILVFKNHSAMALHQLLDFLSGLLRRKCEVNEQSGFLVDLTVWILP